MISSVDNLPIPAGLEIDMNWLVIRASIKFIKFDLRNTFVSLIPSLSIHFVFASEGSRIWFILKLSCVHTIPISWTLSFSKFNFSKPFSFPLYSTSLYLFNPRFLKAIFVSHGGSRNRDSTGLYWIIRPCYNQLSLPFTKLSIHMTGKCSFSKGKNSLKLSYNGKTIHSAAETFPENMADKFKSVGRWSTE